MTLLEAGVALLVMTAAILAVMELFNAAAHERRARQQRQVALLELSNQAERVALLDWNDAAPERLTSWQPSDMLLAVIRQPECSLRVVDDQEHPGTRRIELAIAWKNAAGEEVRPAKLTAWRFSSEASP